MNEATKEQQRVCYRKEGGELGKVRGPQNPEGLKVIIVECLKGQEPV